MRSWAAAAVALAALAAVLAAAQPAAAPPQAAAPLLQTLYWGKALGGAGESPSPVPIALPGDAAFQSLAAEEDHVCGLLANGTAMCLQGEPPLRLSMLHACRLAHC